MTKEEFIAQRFATQLKIAKQAMVLDQIERDHRAQLDALLEAPKREKAHLEDEDAQEHETLLPLIDFIPFKRHDFVRVGEVYYEVQNVVVSFARLYSRYSDVLPDALTAPPKDFLCVKLDCLTIRRSGTLARWGNTLDANSDTVVKADVSEHPCLRRALKQRMRRRLEGGD